MTEPEEHRPLLSRPSPTYESSDYYSELEQNSVEHVSRSIEDDSIPETATLGRHLGWTSAYILVISRVIGSGIFATPGLIFQSLGSIGLSLSVWVIGALAAWLGLTVGLEYGCMLPRSGGMKHEIVHLKQ
jgi:amino acid permease